MKSFIQLFLLTLSIYCFGFAYAATPEFKAGVHYVEVEGELSKTPQATEFFSFYCPHCYRFEPFMADVAAMLPNPEAFKKMHVDGMPGRNQEIERMLSTSLAAANVLKVKDKIVPAIFKYIHEDRANFSNEKDVKNLFLLHGVSSEDYDKTVKSFKVKAMVSKMSKDTEALRRQGHTRVPTLIINNKYKPEVSSLRSEAEYKALVAYLLKKTA